MSAVGRDRSSTFAGGILRGVASLVATWRRRHADRQVYRRMLHFSPHALDDLGLTRDDVVQALSEPAIWDGR